MRKRGCVDAGIWDGGSGVAMMGTIFNIVETK
jgi:hypothetical protein